MIVTPDYDKFLDNKKFSSLLITINADLTETMLKISRSFEWSRHCLGVFYVRLCVNVCLNVCMCVCAHMCTYVHEHVCEPVCISEK